MKKIMIAPKWWGNDWIVIKKFLSFSFPRHSTCYKFPTYDVRTIRRYHSIKHLEFITERKCRNRSRGRSYRIQDRGLCRRIWISSERLHGWCLLRDPPIYFSSWSGSIASWSCRRNRVVFFVSFLSLKKIGKFIKSLVVNIGAEISRWEWDKGIKNPSTSVTVLIATYVITLTLNFTGDSNQRFCQSSIQIRQLTELSHCQWTG